MTQDDLNQIRGVVKGEVDTALQPVIDKLQPAIEKLDIVSVKLDAAVVKLDALWNQTAELTENMTDVRETLSAHTTSLKMITMNTERQAESIEKLNKRVGDLEDKAGIAP